MDNANEFPKCSEKLPNDVTQTIKQLGKLWYASPLRPRISTKTIKKWNELLKSWLIAQDIPIIIRKSGGMRGGVIRHKSSGREIIISDNSPAQWVCYLVLQNIVPTLNDIRSYLRNDKLPISFAIKKSEKDKIKYKCTLGKNSVRGCA